MLGKFRNQFVVFATAPQKKNYYSTKNHCTTKRKSLHYKLKKPPRHKEKNHCATKEKLLRRKEKIIAMRIISRKRK